MIRELGVEDCVVFQSGWVAKIPPMMADAAVMLFPYREIDGRSALLLSYTFGVPVIASDIPSFMEGTDNGKTGILFKSEGPAALKSNIETTLNWTRDDVEVYQRRVQKLVQERHSWKNTAKRTAGAYQRLLNEKSNHAERKKNADRTIARDA